MLGLDEWTSYCRGGVSADGATCDEVLAADAQELVSLKCVAIEGEPPEVPVEEPAWKRYALVALAVAGSAMLGYWAERR